MYQRPQILRSSNGFIAVSLLFYFFYLFLYFCFLILSEISLELVVALVWVSVVEWELPCASSFQPNGFEPKLLQNPCDQMQAQR